MAQIVLLAGLPGVGKSTLAALLAPAIGGAVIDRDQVKASIVPAPFLTHSRRQISLSNRVCAEVSNAVVTEHPHARLIIDGHTFSRRADVARYRLIARETGSQLLLVHCTANEDVVKTRILGDAEGLAKQRTWAKYVEVRDRFEPLGPDALQVDLTDDVAAAVNTVRSHLTELLPS